jgi:hypothetical protein
MIARGEILVQGRRVVRKGLKEELKNSGKANRKGFLSS